MRVVEKFSSGVVLLEPEIYRDERGYFFESFNQRELQRLGIDARFVQDNRSYSLRNVLRGLHYQLQQPQGKLVTALHGEVFDVAVDVRRTSAAFGTWTGVRLSAQTGQSLWIPPGFAHGFLVLSKYADIHYKATDYYAPQHERAIRWNDADLKIEWPLTGCPELSIKDSSAPSFRDAEIYECR